MKIITTKELQCMYDAFWNGYPDSYLKYLTRVLGGSSNEVKKMRGFYEEFKYRFDPENILFLKLKKKTYKTLYHHDIKDYHTKRERSLKKQKDI